jgi:hypothetical protein
VSWRCGRVYSWARSRKLRRLLTDAVFVLAIEMDNDVGIQGRGHGPARSVSVVIRSVRSHRRKSAERPTCAGCGAASLP